MDIRNQLFVALVQNDLEKFKEIAITSKDDAFYVAQSFDNHSLLRWLDSVGGRDYEGCDMDRQMLSLIPYDAIKLFESHTLTEGLMPLSLLQQLGKDPLLREELRKHLHSMYPKDKDDVNHDIKYGLHPTRIKHPYLIGDSDIVLLVEEIDKVANSIDALPLIDKLNRKQEFNIETYLLIKDVIDANPDVKLAEHMKILPIMRILFPSNV